MFRAKAGQIGRHTAHFRPDGDDHARPQGHDWRCQRGMGGGAAITKFQHVGQDKDLRCRAMQPGKRRLHRARPGIIAVVNQGDPACIKRP
ncbi:MAG: Uncharacterised protein [SAR116 cluster bacterium]|nr:MAG: Uncharacterised protein [SAR116 cluster bacterium]